MRTHNKRPHSGACENERPSSCRQTERAARCHPVPPTSATHPPFAGLHHPFIANSELLHQIAFFYRALAFSSFLLPISCLDRWHSFMAVLLPVTAAYRSSTPRPDLLAAPLVRHFHSSIFHNLSTHSLLIFQLMISNQLQQSGTKLDDAFGIR